MRYDVQHTLNCCPCFGAPGGTLEPRLPFMHKVVHLTSFYLHLRKHHHICSIHQQKSNISPHLSETWKPGLRGYSCWPLFWNNLIYLSRFYLRAKTDMELCLLFSVTTEVTCEVPVALRVHYEKTEPSNSNPIFLMIQIVLALVVPKSPLPEWLPLSPLCNPSSRPSYLGHYSPAVESIPHWLI